RINKDWFARSDVCLDIVYDAVFSGHIYDAAACYRLAGRRYGSQEWHHPKGGECDGDIGIQEGKYRPENSPRDVTSINNPGKHQTKQRLQVHEVDDVCPDEYHREQQA